MYLRAKESLTVGMAALLVSTDGVIRCRAGGLPLEVQVDEVRYRTKKVSSFGPRDGNHGYSCA